MKRGARAGRLGGVAQGPIGGKKRPCVRHLRIQRFFLGGGWGWVVEQKWTDRTEQNSDHGAQAVGGAGPGAESGTQHSMATATAMAIDQTRPDEEEGGLHPDETRMASDWLVAAGRRDKEVEAVEALEGGTA